MSIFLYLVEHDRGRIDETATGGMTGARLLAERTGSELHAVVIGAGGEAATDGLAAYGPNRSTW